MEKAAKRFALAMAIIFATGCSNINQHSANNVKNIRYLEPQLNLQIIDTSEVQLVSEQDIFYLSPEQQKEFFDFYAKQLEVGISPHNAVSHFLHTRLSNFSYHGKTYLASEAMSLNTGNCMSLAILTTALAKLVNLDIAYREVNTLPVFEKYGSIILSSSHVQSVIYDPHFVEQKGVVYFQRPAVIIDYFPDSANRVSTKVSKNSLVGKFYANLAAAALIEEDLSAAFANAVNAYKFDKSSQVINLLAILHRRLGDDDTAEKLYRYAINNEQTNLSLLLNYSVLLSVQGRVTELKEIDKKIDTIYDPNPYSWLENAYIAKNENKPARAEKYFQKVIEMAPYVHQAYLGLYQLYLKQSKHHQAEEILTKGLQWTHHEEEKLRYKRKLFSLKQI